MVKVYNEDRARPRSIGAQHIGGDALTEALDALEEGDAAGAGEAFGRAWLDAYGMDDVDANDHRCGGDVQWTGVGFHARGANARRASRPIPREMRPCSARGAPVFRARCADPADVPPLLHPSMRCAVAGDA